MEEVWSSMIFYRRRSSPSACCLDEIYCKDHFPPDATEPFSPPAKAYCHSTALFPSLAARLGACYGGVAVAEPAACRKSGKMPLLTCASQHQCHLKGKKKNKKCWTHLLSRTGDVAFQLPFHPSSSPWCSSWIPRGMFSAFYNLCKPSAVWQILGGRTSISEECSASSCSYLLQCSWPQPDLLGMWL